MTSCRRQFRAVKAAWLWWAGKLHWVIYSTDSLLGGNMEEVVGILRVLFFLFISFCGFKMAHSMKKAAKARAKLWNDYVKGREEKA